MGPLPQTPTDIIVPLMLVPYMADQATMCQTCVFVDNVAFVLLADVDFDQLGA